MTTLDDAIGALKQALPDATTLTAEYEAYVKSQGGSPDFALAGFDGTLQGIITQLEKAQNEQGGQSTAAQAQIQALQASNAKLQQEAGQGLSTGQAIVVAIGSAVLGAIGGSWYAHSHGESREEATEASERRRPKRRRRKRKA